MFEQILLLSRLQVLLPASQICLIVLNQHICLSGCICDETL